ncbi:hypothetical protein LXL04_024209 [Taraxacum kok-saghyz]
MLHTRHDIAFFVQCWSQFNQTPSQYHLDAALYVLRYLKDPMTQGLYFNNDPKFQMEAFCDSYWAACPIISAELAWISLLLTEFQVNDITLISLKCDNLAAIYIV